MGFTSQIGHLTPAAGPGTDFPNNLRRVHHSESVIAIAKICKASTYMRLRKFASTHKFIFRKLAPGQHPWQPNYKRTHNAFTSAKTYVVDDNGDRRSRPGKPSQHSPSTGCKEQERTDAVISHWSIPSAEEIFSHRNSTERNFTKKTLQTRYQSEKLFKRKLVIWKQVKKNKSFFHCRKRFLLASMWCKIS